MPTNPLEQPDDNRLSHYRPHKNVSKHRKKQKCRSEDEPLTPKEHGNGGETPMCCTGTTRPSRPVLVGTEGRTEGPP